MTSKQGRPWRCGRDIRVYGNDLDRGPTDTVVCEQVNDAEREWCANCGERRAVAKAEGDA